MATSSEWPQLCDPNPPLFVQEARRDSKPVQLTSSSQIRPVPDPYLYKNEKFYVNFVACLVHSCLHYAPPWKSTLEWALHGLCNALVEFWEEQHQALCLPEARNFFIKWYYNELHLHRQTDVANAVCARFVHDACSGMFTFRVLHGIRIVKFEGRWVCCSLSFVQLLTVNWFAKVFSAKFGGVASFGAAKASNPWKFSL